jgi:hypothetical protein
MKGQQFIYLVQGHSQILIIIIYIIFKKSTMSKGMKRTDKSPVFDNELSRDTFNNSCSNQGYSDDDDLPDVR